MSGLLNWIYMHQDIVQHWFDVLLTVHLSTVLVSDQLNAQILVL
jgi:hypothetical protein